jgi:hypothetical protein
MRLRNLLRKYQTDPCTTWLRRIKRHEQISSVGQPGPIVQDLNDYLCTRGLPSNLNMSRVSINGIWTQRCIRRVAHKIDERLFDMVRIDLQHDVRRPRDSHSDTPLQLRDPLHQRRQ